MNIGIVGAGGMGSVHARHYANMTGVTVFAYDLDHEKLTGFCTKFSVTQLASFDEILSKCDVVDVCLPTHLHALVALQAIRAGKHTFIEKPMARTLDECRQLVKAAAESKVQVGVGHVVRFFAEYECAHNAVAQGKIGRPASARLRRGGLPPKGFDGWFQDPEKSGGVILDLAIHDFDWLRWTFGEVKSVTAHSVGLGKKVVDAEMVGDYALTILTHDSGVISHVESTWMDPAGFRTTLEVSGSEGVIEWDSRLNPVVRTSVTGLTRADSPMAATDDPYFRQLSSFLDAAHRNVPPPVSILDGMRNVAICEAAIQSARTGQPVLPFFD